MIGKLFFVFFATNAEDADWGAEFMNRTDFDPGVETGHPGIDLPLEIYVCGAKDNWRVDGLYYKEEVEVFSGQIYYKKQTSFDGNPEDVFIVYNELVDTWLITDGKVASELEKIKL